MISNDYVCVSGYCNKDVTNFSGFGNRHYFKTIHCSFQGANWINFGYDNQASHPSCALSYTFTTPAIATNHYFSSCKENIRSAYNAVQGALAGTVTIVKQVLGLSIINRNNRELQNPIFFHGAKSIDPRRGFFHASYNLIKNFSTAFNRVFFSPLLNFGMNFIQPI